MGDIDTQKSDGELCFTRLDTEGLSRLKEKLTECDSALCDYTTGGLLFGMRSLYKPEIAEGACASFISVLSEEGGEREFLMPIPFSLDAVDELCAYAKKENAPLTFSGLSEPYAKIIAEHLNAEYSMTDRLSDYVYDAQALSALEGKHYHTQRTNIRKLERTHKSWEYQSITAENLPDAIACADALFEGLDLQEKYAEAGRDIVYDSLYNLDALGMSGGILYIDGTAAGIAVGTLKQEMLYIHVLRARREIWGAWNLLCREFVRAHAGKAKLVNMEDDLDNEGIRRMKRSYSPINFIKRCRIEVK